MSISYWLKTNHMFFPGISKFHEDGGSSSRILKMQDLPFIMQAMLLDINPNFRHWPSVDLEHREARHMNQVVEGVSSATWTL